MFQQTPESEPRQGPQESEPKIEITPAGEQEEAEALVEISPERVKNIDAAQVEAKAEETRRSFESVFGKEQADAWLESQRPEIEAEMKKYEAIDRVSDAMVILMAQSFMKEVGRSKGETARAPVMIMSSGEMGPFIEALQSTGAYQQDKGIVEHQIGPVVQAAIDKFSAYLCGKTASYLQREVNTAPGVNRITPELVSNLDLEYVRTNIDDVAIGVGGDSFVILSGKLPALVPTIDVLMAEIQKRKGTNRPEDFTR